MTLIEKIYEIKRWQIISSIRFQPRRSNFCRNDSYENNQYFENTFSRLATILFCRDRSVWLKDNRRECIVVMAKSYETVPASDEIKMTPA